MQIQILGFPKTFKLPNGTLNFYTDPLTQLLQASLNTPAIYSSPLSPGLKPWTSSAMLTQLRFVELLEVLFVQSAHTMRARTEFRMHTRMHIRTNVCTCSQLHTNINTNTHSCIPSRIHMPHWRQKSTGVHPTYLVWLSHDML